MSVIYTSGGNKNNYQACKVSIIISTVSNFWQLHFLYHQFDFFSKWYTSCSVLSL